MVGAVARYTSDLALAEDVVQEAFERALQSPVLLRNPTAWITTTARHIAIDRIRSDRSLARSLSKLAHSVAELGGEPETLETFLGDERLVLIALIAVPGIREEDRLALALRFVCGVPTSDIATVLLVPPTTLAARLTRAKKRLHANPGLIQLEGPATAVTIGQRLDIVLDTVFLLYTAGYSSPLGSVARATALQLSRELAALFPEHLETQGLLALILLTEARRPPADFRHGASMAGDDDVDLEDSNRSQWNSPLINEGLLLAAAALAGGGRFSLMAGISGLHDVAARWEDTEWDAIAALYDGLLGIWPVASVALNRTIARSMMADVGPSLALAELDSDFPRYSGQLRWQAWAARADMLRRLGLGSEAANAYRCALEGALDDGDRTFLLRRIRELKGK